LFAAYSILGYYDFMAKPSALVILCGFSGRISMEDTWHSILKYNYCTVHADIVHPAKLRLSELPSGSESLSLKIE
jgi:hypothetical protein